MASKKTTSHNKDSSSHRFRLTLNLHDFSIYDYDHRTHYYSSTNDLPDFDTELAINSFIYMSDAFSLVKKLFQKLDEHLFTKLADNLRTRVNSGQQLSEMEIQRTVIHTLYSYIEMLPPTDLLLAVKRFSEILHFIHLPNVVPEIAIEKLPRKLKHYRQIDCSLSIAEEEYIDEPFQSAIDIKELDTKLCYAKVTSVPPLQQAVVSVHHVESTTTYVVPSNDEDQTSALLNIFCEYQSTVLPSDSTSTVQPSGAISVDDVDDSHSSSERTLSSQFHVGTSRLGMCSDAIENQFCVARIREEESLWYRVRNGLSDWYRRLIGQPPGI